MAGGEQVRRAISSEHRPERRLWLVLAGVLAVAAVLLGVAVAREGGGKRVRADAGPTSTSAEGGSAPTGGADGGAGATSSPTSDGTTTTPPRGPKAITLVFAGDLLPHGPLNARAAAYGQASGVPYDYAPMLAPMQPIISGADLAICHMEVPVAPPGEAITTYPSFGAPPELVDGVRSAGYDGCSTASNHSLDRGRAGIQATLDRFDQDGLKHTGTARTAEEAEATTTYDVQGVQVAHLSYAYGFNGYPVPADAPWSVNEISPERIRADAARARSAGADLVVVSLHWGTEYRAEPDEYQQKVAAQILPSPDIDLVIGCHAHVVQPIGQVGGTFVVWGMGNQVSNQSQPERRDGITVRAGAVRDADGRWKVFGVEAIPTWVERGSFRVLPVVDALADPATPAGLRSELTGSYQRTRATIDGAAPPGVTVAPAP